MIVCTQTRENQSPSSIHFPALFAAAAGGSDEEQGQAEAANADDLEVAWEVLEVARLIYTDLPQTEENQLALSDVHTAIGTHTAFRMPPSGTSGSFPAVMFHRTDSRVITDTPCQVISAWRTKTSLTHTRILLKRSN